ncbi:MAG: hypothetical protein ACIWVG_06950 [Gloeotrichia echinulata HAB0833]
MRGRWEINEAAVTATLETEDAETANDPYRGLHITLQDLESYLSQPPGDPTFPTAANISPTELIPPDSRLAQLQQEFGLSDFDIDILVIALAPECDRNGDRIYAKACSKTSSDAIRSINIKRSPLLSVK